MRQRFFWALSAIVAMAFPFGARADLSGTVTLTMGDRFSFDTGVTSTTNPAPMSGSAGPAWFRNRTSGSSTTRPAAQPALLCTTALPNRCCRPCRLRHIRRRHWPVPHSSWETSSPCTPPPAIYAKVLITAFTSGNNGSLALQYTTFGAPAGGPNAPMISAIENAATNVPPGLPNAAIAQGALFVVKGKNLGPANAVVATAFPLPASIGGTSMKVTVGGTTVNVIMYYSLAAQIAGILPSKTPAGTGTLTVTYNGLDSATVPIVVVPNNIGVFTLNTTGSGDAVATLPATNTVVSPTNAPNPGEIITLWATGLGAVSGDESQPAQQADLTNIPLKVFIAGQPANVLFRGRNACCSGVDTIYVTVPQGLTGCANSVIMQIGNLVSNATSIPIGTNGRNCVPIAPESDGRRSGVGNPFLRRVVPGPPVDHYRRDRTSSGTDRQNGSHRGRV